MKRSISSPLNRNLIGRSIFLCLLSLLSLSACSLFYTRPVQVMSNTQAAIRAAKEVQADTLSPDYYRLSNEWFFKARNAYQIKEFKIAEEDANKARHYAEMAEFDSIRNGGNRSDPANNPAPPEPEPTPSPYAYPTPKATPYNENAGPQSGATTTPPTSITVPGVNPIPAPTP